MDLKVKGKQQVRAAAELMTFANSIGMDMDGYGELGYNERSGNTYLWLGDYNFDLFISDFDDGIQAMWTNGENGEGHIMKCNSDTTLEAIDRWASELEHLEDEDEEE